MCSCIFSIWKYIMQLYIAKQIWEADQRNEEGKKDRRRRNMANMNTDPTISTLSKFPMSIKIPSSLSLTA